VTHTFVERARERRADPIMATLIDVAISYRENLGGHVAEAFLRETGVPAALAQRVLDGSAGRRSAPRRLALAAQHDQARDLA
jgi:hypothetical protein